MNGSSIPNQDQAELWNGSSGRAWVDLQGLLDELLAPFVPFLLEPISRDQAHHVLDVGCGSGATTLAVARRLGSRGRCVGVDISTPLIEVARARAAREKLENATFVCADAQTHAFEAASFDAVISRFGVMFFEDPVAAFSNIRRGTRSGGNLTFIAWRSPAENPFMTAAARAAAPFLPALPTPDPEGPGQFGFANPDRVRRILTASGWTNIDLQPIDVPGVVGKQDLMTYVTRLGPVGLALQDADDATRAKVTAAVRDAFVPFIENDQVRFSAACWLVTARG